MTRIYRPLYACFYSLRSKGLISMRFGEKVVGKMAWVKRREGDGEGGEEWLSFPFSRGQNRKSRSPVFLWSKTKRKRLLRMLLFLSSSTFCRSVNTQN